MSDQPLIGQLNPPSPLFSPSCIPLSTFSSCSIFSLSQSLSPFVCLCLYLPLPFALSELTDVSIVQSLQGCVRRGHNSVVGKAELGAVGQLQAEMLHLDLIDGADGYRDDKESSKELSSTAPLPITEDPALVTMDIYRPKRPTTLNLFPMVPHTQVSPNEPSVIPSVLFPSFRWLTALTVPFYFFVFNLCL